MKTPKLFFFFGTAQPRLTSVCTVQWMPATNSTICTVKFGRFSHCPLLFSACKRLHTTARSVIYSHSVAFRLKTGSSVAQLFSFNRAVILEYGRWSSSDSF